MNPMLRYGSTGEHVKTLRMIFNNAWVCQFGGVASHGRSKT
jgi:hypothetical protein